MDNVAQLPVEPICDQGAEHNVIGCLLIKSSLWSVGYQLGLDEDCFVIDDCKRAFNAIDRLTKRGTPVDLQTVSDEIDPKDGPLLSRLHSIANGTPSTAAFETHVAKAKESAALRKVKETLARVTKALNDGDLTKVSRFAQDLTDNLNANETGWDEPIPFEAELKPVLPFDKALIPASLRPWVVDIAHRTQCPIEFVAVTAMVAAASVVAGKVTVRPKKLDSWRVIPNLWGLIIARPSQKKTPAVDQALKIIQGLQNEKSEAFKTDLEEHAVDVEFQKISAKVQDKEIHNLIKAKKDVEARALLQDTVTPPEAPTMKRYIVNDTTVESLGVILKDNPEGVLVVRDELRGLFAKLEQEDQQEARAFYLQGFNGGQPYSTDRIGRGHIEIQSVTISIIGGIQPGKLAPTIKGALDMNSSDDGFFQRFQCAVYPDEMQWDYVDAVPNQQAEDDARAVFKRLDSIRYGEPIELVFDELAQDVLINWFYSLQHRIEHIDLHPAMVSHLGKYGSLIPSLAGVIHLCDGNESQSIDESTLDMAIRWGELLESHADRIYDFATNDSTEPAKKLLSKLIDAISNGRMQRSFTQREITRKCWAGLKTIEEIEGAAKKLIEHGYLASEPSATRSNGRPSIRYCINPHVLKNLKT